MQTEYMQTEGGGKPSPRLGGGDLFARHLQAGLVEGTVLASGARAAADEAITRGDSLTPPPTGEPGAVRDLEDGENAQVARVRAQLAFHPKRHALSENAKAMSLQVRPPLEEPASLSHTLF